MAVRHNHGACPARASRVTPESDPHVASGPELREGHAPGGPSIFLPVHRGGRIANHTAAHKDPHGAHGPVAALPLTTWNVCGSQVTKHSVLVSLALPSARMAGQG
jgi:hypothetical protein